MWNKSSVDVAVSELKKESTASFPKPAVVKSIAPGSIGEELGFEPGDQLLKINGVRPRDLIDYRFLTVEEELHLEIMDSAGTIHYVDLEKEADDSLGLTFTEALFDGLRQCNNQCPFCFIDQQPPGHRDSLYLKDDDYRLSFLYGSYLTLTNLKDSDWKRIESQRLSPLYVSVHATQPELRAQLLHNSRAGLLMQQLDWFAQRNLQIHAQVVICPGLNDGKALDNTLQDLAIHAKGDWPVVLSTAIVPVGLTRFRPQNDGLIPIDTKCARQVIAQVELLQKKFKKTIGSNFAWLSDEWYLIAQKPLPARSAYEDLPQQENGVGSIRAFLENMDIATANLPSKIQKPKKCSWVVGRLVEKALIAASNKLNEVEGLTLHIFGLPSAYWGQDQVVTGLLTGADLIEGLKNKDLGEQLLLPSVMLKHGEDVFLDDMSLKELCETLQVPIRIVHGADDIVAAAIED
ncbi:TIGR03279 family radical SAM protein [Prochlorococcus sp. MIT 1307]|uniref:TIGR03279 family radical SAM protein n=1 Tax=Prochlorococcus sp. MIT 1307 TaxID=3096219 RepID=UPI002A756DC9|nr:TIGR03279 family radical SAM protein [Prochlorococcus sp. MIT 1307]